MCCTKTQEKSGVVVKTMTDQQKIFSGLAGAAVLLLVAAIAVALNDSKIPYGFFVFLRIMTCGALVGLMLEKLPIWAKFVLLLLAILYNPVVPIHLGDREVWAWFNTGTIPALVVPWAWIWKQKGKI